MIRNMTAYTAMAIPAGGVVVPYVSINYAGDPTNCSDNARGVSVSVTVRNELGEMATVTVPHDDWLRIAKDIVASL